MVVVGVVGVVVGVVASDLQRAKPAIAKGWMHDSAPPATITSASPSATMRAASPSACRPVVHAVVVAWFGPRKPWRMEMWPLARLMSSRGTKSGETLE